MCGWSDIIGGRPTMSYLTDMWPHKERDPPLSSPFFVVTQHLLPDLSGSIWTQLEGKNSFITVCQHPSETLNLFFLFCFSSLFLTDSWKYILKCENVFIWTWKNLFLIEEMLHSLGETKVFWGVLTHVCDKITSFHCSIFFYFKLLLYSYFTTDSHRQTSTDRVIYTIYNIFHPP